MITPEEILAHANALLSQKKINDALEVFSKACQYPETRGAASHQMGLIYYQKGEFDTAIHYFQEAVSLSSDDAILLNNLGVLYFKTEKYTDAEQVLRQALQIDSCYVDALLNLGKVMTALNKPASAIDAGLSCLKLQPNHENAQKMLSKIKTSNGQKKWQSIYQSILVVMEEGIGNMVMLTPTLRALKAWLPDSKITVWGRQPSIQVIDGWGCVDNILTEPDDSQYDLCFLSIWSQTTVNKNRSWFISHCKEILTGKLYNDQHESDSHYYLLHCLEYNGKKPLPYCSSQPVSLKLEKGKKWVALSDTTLNNPAWQRKRWPYYFLLARELVNLNYGIILIGGQSEAEEFKSQDWPKDTINALGKYSIGETASILEQCDLFIGNDSGPAHMAAALGIKTYVIFGATRIDKNKPLGKHVQVISKFLNCSPCQYTDRWNTCKDWRCTKTISANDVIKVIDPETKMHSKSVLIVGVLDKHGSTNISIRDAFAMSGWNVYEFNYRTIASEYSIPMMNHMLRQNVKNNQYDLVFLCKANILSSDTVHFCSQHTTTWLWFMDPIETARSCYTVNLVREAHFASATYSDTVELFKTVNENSFHIFDGADQNIYKPLNLDKDIDIAFIGNYNERRDRFISNIREHFKVSIFGANWNSNHPDNHSSIYGNEFIEICSRSKIMLNFPSFEGQSGFSVRIFNVMASGTFILSESLKDLFLPFKIGKHLDTFSDEKECLEKIDYYLNHNKIRETIAKTGREHVLKHYLWKNTIHHIEHKLNTCKSVDKDNKKKILFLFWHGLGDNVLATPAIKKYKQLFPNTQIGWATKKDIAAQRLLEYCAEIDYIYPILSNPWKHPNGYEEGINQIIEEAKKIYLEERYDEIRLIPTKHDGNFKPHKIYRVANEMGVVIEKSKELKTEVIVPDEINNEAEKFLSTFKKPIIFFHGETGFPQKNPPPELCQQIIKTLNEMNKYTVIEVGTHFIKDSVFLDYSDLLFTAAIISKSDYVVAADSICMHIAGAFEKPMTALFTTFPSHQVVPLSYTNFISIDFTEKENVSLKVIREHFDNSISMHFNKSKTNFYQLPPGLSDYRIKFICYGIVQGHKSLLDVSCGKGAFLDYFKWKGFDVEGTEFTLKQVNLIRAKGIPCQQVNLNDKNLKLPYDDNKFDVVILTEVLEHIQYPRTVINELIRVAKEVVVFTTPAGNSYASPDHINHWNNRFELAKDVLHDTWNYQIDEIVTKPEDWPMNQRCFIVTVSVNEIKKSKISNDRSFVCANEDNKIGQLFNTKISELLEPKNVLYLSDILNNKLNVFSNSTNLKCLLFEDVMEVELEDEFDVVIWECIREFNHADSVQKLLDKKLSVLYKNSQRYLIIISNEKLTVETVNRYIEMKFLNMGRRYDLEKKIKENLFQNDIMHIVIFEKRMCVMCGEPLSAPIIENLMHCEKCDVFQQFGIPSKAYLRQALQNFMLGACFDKNKETERLLDANYQLDLLSKYAKIGKIFDVGAAAGFFMKAARDRGWTVDGNEVSKSAILWAQKEYNIPIQYGFLEDLKLQFNNYNAVVLWNTLEHTINPKDTLKICHDLLENNGIILIKVPNKKGAELKRWYEPFHFYEFNQDNLSEFLCDAGFTGLEIITENGNPPTVIGVFIKKS